MSKSTVKFFGFRSTTSAVFAKKNRKKVVFGIVLASFVLVAGFVLFAQEGYTAMPEENCENLAVKKDLIVQKMAKIEVLFDNGYFQDVCTGGWHNSATRYSNDYNSPSYQRWEYPGGTITGTIDQGYLGGMQLNYTICPDGRGWMYQMAGGGKGYGVGNYKVLCNTIF